MCDLVEKCLTILNDGHFQVIDPGPLHQPLLDFSIRRDEQLRLILVTHAVETATSAAVRHPLGTVRTIRERVLLKSSDGLEGELFGVSPRRKTLTIGDAEGKLKEEAQVQVAKTTNPSAEPEVRIIDWLENLRDSPFIWPDRSNLLNSDTDKLELILGDEITIIGGSRNYRHSYNAAKLTIDGIKFYVCAQKHEDRPGSINPGCIIYDGIPSEMFRRKIRVALSLVLGLYLIDIGSTHYNSEWEVVYTISRSAYSIHHQAFELPPMPIAPLGKRYLHELDPVHLTRAVSAFVESFETLDLGKLNWAYWHACTAAPHIAPALFGAVIEGLQSSYIKANRDKVRQTWVPTSAWEPLRDRLVAAINDASLSVEAKSALESRIHILNQTDQGYRFKYLLKSLNINISDEEHKSWRRRNKAAHGTHLSEGDELAAIRDTKLLRGLVQRLLLRVTGAADQYIDYVSLHHPYRSISEAPSENSVPS